MKLPLPASKRNILFLCLFLISHCVWSQAPVITEPVNGATVATSGFAVKVAPHANATQVIIYIINANTGATYSQSGARAGTGEVVYNVVPGLSPSTPYQIRATAWTSAGVLSSTINVTTSNVASPSPHPVILAPTNGATIATTGQVVRIAGNPYNDYTLVYLYEAATNALIRGGPYLYGTGEVSYELPPGLKINTTYRIMVRRYTTGGYGVYDANVWVTTNGIATPPLYPVFIAPVNGAPVPSTGVKVELAANPHNVQTYIDVFNISTGTFAHRGGALTGTGPITYALPVAFTTGAAYRIEARSMSTNWGAWHTNQITVNASVPLARVVSPTGGTNLSRLDHAFGAEPAGSTAVAQYNWEIQRTETTTPPQQPATKAGQNVQWNEYLLRGKSYRVRVTGLASGQTSGLPSDWVSFSVAPALTLDQPRVVTVDGTAVEPGGTPPQMTAAQYPLGIGRVANADRYHLQFDDDPAFASIDLRGATDLGNYLLNATSLRPNVRYYVRVEAENTQVPGEKSVVAGAPVVSFINSGFTALPAAPDENRNFVTVNTVLAGGKKSVGDLQGLSVADLNQQTTYLDGLGRPVQGVITQGSPDRKDIVQPILYDQFGRTPTSYMPFTAGNDGKFKTGVVDVTADPAGYTNSAQYQFYQNLPGVAADSKPFAQTTFEASPLSTVTESGGVGSAWNGKTAKPTYRTNTAEEDIREWNYTPNADPELFGTISATATYAAATLHMSEVRDEDNHQVRQYTDKLGQVVLKRAYLSATETLDTYYVYDDFGNLRAVVPPKAVGELPPTSSWAPTSEFVNKLCFTYCYDKRKRLIEKQAPGTKPVYVVYNKRDEVVLSQDANQRHNGQWSFTKYDALGRTVLTGMYASTQTRSALQGTADANETNHQFEERTPNATFQYYTNRAFPVLPTNGADLYAVMYYDDYDFDNNGTADRTFDTSFDGQFSQAPRPNYLAGTTRIVGTEGLATGSRVRILDKPNSGHTTARWQETVTFYDAEYQPIQVQASHHGGGVDVVTTAYDFAGRVVKTFRRHTNPQSVGAAPVEVAARVQYDHMSRPLALYHQVNGQAEEQLSTLSFNELGQVISKRVGRTGLQKMDYAYNIRGWLTRINNAALDTPDDNDLFGMEFFYNEGTDTRFDGNITRIRWKSKLDGVTRQYQYGYDALSRLENATYSHNNDTPGERFSLTGIKYDKNGNIDGFSREGLQSRDHNKAPVFGTVDILKYDYDGNQLKTVDDDGTGTGIGGDFVDGYKQTSGALREYIFDDNGNLFKDHNKKIESIVYNALNLPEFVYFDGSNQNYIEYLYDGAGGKLQKRLYQGGSLRSTTDYLNGYVYGNDELEFFHTSEGRVLSPKLSGTGAFAYEYHYNDQTGNLRVAFREQGPRQYFRAGMEVAQATEEDLTFSNVSLTRDGGKSCSGVNGAKVYASRALGPWKTIKVGKGDKVYASTRAIYTTAATSHGPQLSIYLSNVGSAASAGGEQSQNKTSLLTIGAGLVPDFSQPVGRPKAYLQYIFYDKQEKFVRYDRVAIKTKADECDFLELNFTAEQDGYVQVLVANESSTDTWFDDLEITYTPGLIVQEQHYDPWGLNLAGIEKDGDYPFQFNSGSEKQQDASGHGYFYETDFRGYDPQLGRFRGVDALADIMPGISPYHFSYNNPVSFSDPTGLFADPLTGYVIGQTVNYLIPRVAAHSLASLTASAVGTGLLTAGLQAAGAGGCCGGSGGNGGAQAAQGAPSSSSAPANESGVVVIGTRMPIAQKAPPAPPPAPKPGSLLGRLVRGAARATGTLGTAGLILAPTSLGDGTNPVWEQMEQEYQQQQRAKQWDFDELSPEELRDIMDRLIKGEGDYFDRQVRDYFAPKKQLHHYASDKHNSRYTNLFRNIASKYDLDLDDDWNKEYYSTRYHLGSHHADYHDFVLDGMQRADQQVMMELPNGSLLDRQKRFIDLFNQYVKQPVRNNPDMLRYDFW